MKRKVLFALVGILLFVVAFIVVAYPKKSFATQDDSLLRCDCYGSSFWYGTRCVGIPYHCTHEEQQLITRSCEQPTCSEVIARIGDVDTALARNLSAKTGSDIVLVIDLSQSMQGDKLSAAKIAAKQLVNNLQSGERIGIVGFSNVSHIVHNFSSDKESLINSINTMAVSGGTRYIPGLITAQELFSAQPREETNKGIIFLSDGIPDEQQGQIIATVAALKKDDISLFTLDFGDSNDTSNILRRMIEGQEGVEGNQWYRSFSGSQEAVQAFSEAWDQLTVTKAISLSPLTAASSFSPTTASSFGVRASFGSLVLSGKEDNPSLCVPNMSVVAKVGNREIPLTVGETAYYLPEGALLPGTYNLSVHASFRANHNGSCFFSGDLAVGSLTITNATNQCDLVTCGKVREALDDYNIALREGVVLPHHDGSWRVAMIVDASDSMAPYISAITKTIDRLNRLLSSRDERALILFADEARLAIPLTNDKELFSAKIAINPAGTTRVLPALSKVKHLFADNQGTHDVAVLVTDGAVHDQSGRLGVIAAAQALVDEGTCFFVLGYGTDLLRDEDAQTMLQDITRYSLHHLDCGGYAYSPQADDLSLLTSEMFGGLLATNESLRLVVDRAVIDRALATTVQVTSSATGLRLPVRSDALCVPTPLLNASLTNAGREIPVIIEERDPGVFVVRSSALPPGKYLLSLHASLPVDNCDRLTGSDQESFVVMGTTSVSGTGMIIGVLVLLLVAVIVLVRFALSQN